ncbi:hypothetical protein [Cognaticolwellia beringensis]|uniref:Uncharacterized protein n=1 Tax=Cognaticolwellia beringensis TaxID=1967665 RepID=A0A222G5W9_9GAMM|nr:hypothetical protein [Cognaticolwellia beringensis]ASP47132.1 hypothetical protein B5D82_04740 [Cognaticolwellia beringensis]
MELFTGEFRVLYPIAVVILFVFSLIGLLGRIILILSLSWLGYHTIDSLWGLIGLIMWGSIVWQHNPGWFPPFKEIFSINQKNN